MADPLFIIMADPLFIIMADPLFIIMPSTSSQREDGMARLLLLGMGIPLI